MQEWNLQALYDRAIKEKKWFFTNYQNIWFTPEELKKLNLEEKRFCWGAQNWILRDPAVYVEIAEQELNAAKQNHAAALRRYEEWEKSL